MKIRNFQPTDSEQCAALIKENEEDLSDIYDTEGIEKASLYNKYWVCEDGEVMMGMIGLCDLNNKIGMLATLCVGNNYQRKGVGTKLLRWAIVKSKKMGFKKLLMITHVYNKPMMILAIKEGFIPEGSLRKNFRDGRDVVYLSYFIDGM